MSSPVDHRLVSAALVACSLVASVDSGCECRSEPPAQRAQPSAPEPAPPSMPRELVTAIEVAEVRARRAFPEGAGRDLVVGRCASCHSLAIIAQQRKDRPGWTRTLGVMKSWGTPLTADEELAMLDYLEAHFGAVAVRPTGPSE